MLFYNHEGYEDHEENLIIWLRVLRALRGKKTPHNNLFDPKILA
jgi:hypothetical protein